MAMSAETGTQPDNPGQVWQPMIQLLACPRCLGTMAPDPLESDGTRMCLRCGYRNYPLAPLPYSRESNREDYSRDKTAEDRAAAVRLTRQGWSIMEIAQDLGVRASTVERYLQQARQEGVLAPVQYLDLAAVAHYARRHGKQAAAQEYRTTERTVYRALKQEQERLAQGAGREAAP